MLILLFVTSMYRGCYIYFQCSDLPILFFGRRFCFLHLGAVGVLSVDRKVYCYTSAVGVL